MYYKMIHFAPPLLLAVFALGTTLSHAQEPSTSASEVRLYAGQHLYFEESGDALEHTVPELHGLKSASTQESLPSILEKTGNKVEELLTHLPNLNSNESVSKDEVYDDPNQSLPGHRPLQSQDNLGGSLGVVPNHAVPTFNYMVLVQKTPTGRVLEEYRTDQKGRLVSAGPETPMSVGFVTMWAIFSPANQRECRFHYLGEQTVGGHDTFAVAFAQMPGKVAHPGIISLPDGGTIPMLSQGVAWIDKSDFRILRLRTDLLKPQPQVKVDGLTAIIQFGSVRIEKLDIQLWLPVEVKTTLEAENHTIREWHRYSKFRLFKTESRIVTGQ